MQLKGHLAGARRLPHIGRGDDSGLLKYLARWRRHSASCNGLPAAAQTLATLLFGVRLDNEVPHEIAIRGIPRQRRKMPGACELLAR